MRSLLTLVIFASSLAGAWNLPEDAELPPTVEEHPLNLEVAPLIQGAEKSWVFSKRSGPDWIQVTEAGRVHGNPPEGSYGTYRLKIKVTDGKESDSFRMRGVVVQKNYAPSIEPVTLNAKERSPLTASLARHVLDRNPGDSLTFQLKRPSEWYELTADGVFSATPQFKQIGTHSIEFTVSDGKATSEGTLKLTVLRDPRPPVWVQELPRVRSKTRETVSLNLAQSAQDRDGLALTFSKRRGPDWLKVSASGEVSGTPEDRDAGEREAILQVRNDVLTAEHRLILSIEKKNYPPVLNAPLTLQLPERESRTITLGKNGNVTDADAERLAFESQNLPSWATLSPWGDLKLTPTFGDIGTKTFTIKVRDHESAVDLPCTLTVVRNPRPPVWNLIPAFAQLSREPFKATISGYAQDADKLPLRFSKIAGPPWISVSPSGELSGTPSDADTGDNTVTVAAANDVLSATTKLTIRITKKNYPPILAHSFEGTVKERHTIRLSLKESGSVTDPDQEKLVYTQKSPLPPWLTLGPDGTLTATPAYKDIGMHRLSVLVKDRQESVELPIALTVQRVPRGPQWTAEKIQFETLTREPFNASIKGKASDLDAKTFTYSKLQGPEWLQVSPQGELSGQPQDADAGKYEVVLQAHNGELGSPKKVSLLVKMKNHAPIVRAMDWKCKEREVCRLRLSDPVYVEDSDKDTLAFTLTTPVKWATLLPNGKLELHPQFADIGKHRLSFSVSDGLLTVPAMAQVEIERNPRPPVWSQNRIVFSVKARETIKKSLHPFVQDLDGLAIQFIKVGGPDWIKLTSQGEIQADPTDSQVGNHFILVEAANDLSRSKTKVHLDVLFKNHAPQWSKSNLRLGTVRAGESLKTTVRNLASDTDPDPLSFEKVRGPDWAKVSADGKVTISPPLRETGTAKVTIRVRDPENETAEITAEVDVAKEVPTPSLKENLTLPVAYSGELFTFHLTKLFGHAPYTYRLLEGPTWLKLAPAGEMSGVPREKQEFKIVLEVVSPNGEQSRFAGKGKVE